VPTGGRTSQCVGIRHRIGELPQRRPATDGPDREPPITDRPNASGREALGPPHPRAACRPQISAVEPAGNRRPGGQPAGLQPTGPTPRAASPPARSGREPAGPPHPRVASSRRCSASQAGRPRTEQRRSRPSPPHPRATLRARNPSNQSDRPRPGRQLPTSTTRLP
jgi:hypothetical protein